MGFLDADNAFYIVRGSSKVLVLALTDPSSGRPVDLTGARVLLSVKAKGADAIPAFTKDSSASSITIPEPRAGVANVLFSPADTHNLDPGQYLFDLWLIQADTSRICLVEESTLEVRPSITRIPLS